MGGRSGAKAYRPARGRAGNAEIARALREMGLFLEMDAVPFKPRAYEKAAQAVAALERPLAELDAKGGARALEALPSIGHGIAERIDEMLRQGTMHDLEALRKATPVDVLGLAAIEGLGPRRIKALFEALGVRDRADLERACRAGRVREVPGFGERSEARILAGLAFLGGTSGRRLLGTVRPLARSLEERLAAVEGVRAAAVAGSIRRGRETIGDVDVIVASEAPAAAIEAFVGFAEVEHVHARGATKARVRLAGGLDADLRVVKPSSYGAALLYFTGSKAHNVALRRIAQSKGLKLNEYGLFRDGTAIAGRTEAEVYRALGLSPVPPEMREDQGEIDAARRKRLPRLIRQGDLRGDLQVQTDWTDGSDSIEALVAAARELGLEYLAITDHTRDLAMAHGSDEQRLMEQVRAIRALNRELRGFRVLTGAEVNIREDGSLDVDDEVLAQLEVVGAAVHAHFRQPRATMTRRVIRAMANPHVDVLFHPTARLLGRREALDLDLDAVIEAARRTGTVLEIDAMPDRLDLPDVWVRKAVEAGVALAIDSDAHAASHLAYADAFGVTVARRGWARRADVVNAWPVARCLARLKGGGVRRS